MSIQRYRQIEPVELSTIDRYIPAGMTVALVGQDPVLFVDLDLSDDAGKDDLDQYMVTLGWVFVETDPTSPRPTLAAEFQGPVIQMDLTAPPGGPTAGDRYIVATGGTGDWAGHDNEIAEWDGAAWLFTAPAEGMSTWDKSEKAYQDFDGASDWEPGSPQELAVFSAADGILTATSAPTAVTRNDREMLAYPDSATSTAYFTGVAPRNYVVTGPLRAKVFWVAATATSGDVRWSVAFERLDTGGPNVDSDNFGGNELVNATTAVNGEINLAVIPFTNAEADGIKAGNALRIRVRRMGSSPGDTMTGDAQVMRVVIVQ
jgi:hypothetical protein